MWDTSGVSVVDHSPLPTTMLHELYVKIMELHALVIDDNDEGSL